MKIVPLAPRVLSCRALAAAAPALLAGYGVDPARFTSIGLLTCDQDDSLYVALDHATKFAEVEVVFARSFYAGASHGSGPLSGESLGVIAGAEPDSIAIGLEAAVRALEEEICFYQVQGGGPAFFPHVIAETGTYLSAQAGIAAGEPMAYLIAPPMESSIALDAALKAADVRMLKCFPPPTETNYAGAYLGGKLDALEAAARAFAEAVCDVAERPKAGLRRSAERRS